MFEDYKAAVLDFYRKQKNLNQLSGNLENPGREKLRKEFLHVFSTKQGPIDDKLFKSFFDPLNRFNDHIKSMERFDLDKFRPLINFLNGENTIRNEEPVKLLAWLINFESYQEWRSKKDFIQSEPESEVEIIVDERDTVHIQDVQEPKNLSQDEGDEKPELPKGGEILEKGIEEAGDVGAKGTPGDVEIGKPLAETEVSPPNDEVEEPITVMPLSIRTFFITSATVLLLGYCGLLFWEYTTGSTRMPASNEKCMYWTGDHYEPAACEQKIRNASLIPLNIQTLNQLKKIALPDTLTKNALKKVWYATIAGEHQFFTDSGMHPLDTLKRLRPVTPYILAHHVSYYRYILSLLGWGACLFGFSIILAICVTANRRKSARA